LSISFYSKGLLAALHLSYAIAHKVIMAQTKPPQPQGNGGFVLIGAPHAP
jgi:hypothetical protein